jgi:hypothetical protein
MTLVTRDLRTCTGWTGSGCVSHNLMSFGGRKKITVCGQVLAIISIHFYCMMCQTNVSHETQWIETIWNPWCFDFWVEASRRTFQHIAGHMAMHIVHHQYYWQQRHQNDSDRVIWTRHHYIIYPTRDGQAFRFWSYRCFHHKFQDGTSRTGQASKRRTDTQWSSAATSTD